MQYELFGTERYPLRPSKLDKIAKCSVLAVMTMFDVEDDLGGKAAQTGNLIHEGAAAFHRESEEVEKVASGLKALQAASLKFPDGELEDAKREFLLYAADPRNFFARPLAIEKEVTLRLPCDESDPTGQEIFINGTIDQVRQDQDGQLRIYDIKSGEKTWLYYMSHYAYQMSAYLLAARQSLGYNITGAKLILTKTYRRRNAPSPESLPDGVFCDMSLSLERAVYLMDRIRYEVANIRKGVVQFGPGDQCTYCPFGSYPNCVPLVEAKLGIQPSNLISLF